MRAISKSFGGGPVLTAVDLDINGGEIHALLGENGAGKTTLMRILAGELAPDSGSIAADASLLHLDSPRDALEHGIGLVAQHPIVVRQLSVAENLALGRGNRRELRLRRPALTRWAGELCERFDVSLDPEALVASLSIDQVQQVEILRLLGREVSTLVLDEPTAVLAPPQVDRLFRSLHQLADAGKAVVVVTHKLREVIDHAHRASILRHGKLVTTLASPEFDEDELAVAVVGSEFDSASVYPARPRHEVVPSAKQDGVAPIAIQQLVVADSAGARAVDELSCEVQAGEIVGIAGVEGNGQTELIEALAGVRPIETGSVRLGETELRSISPRTLDRLGVALISGDRLRWDIVPNLSVSENLMLSDLVDRRTEFSRWGVLSAGKIKAEAGNRMRAFDVRPATPELAVRHLSGGNQQRLVLARELSRQPTIVIAAYPTRGLDVGAVQFIHQALRSLRDKGSAVLVLSSDRDELISLSDRVGVLYRGQLNYLRPVDGVDLTTFGRAMIGLPALASEPVGA